MKFSLSIESHSIPLITACVMEIWAENPSLEWSDDLLAVEVLKRLPGGREFLREIAEAN